MKENIQDPYQPQQEKNQSFIAVHNQMIQQSYQQMQQMQQMQQYQQVQPKQVVQPSHTPTPLEKNPMLQEYIEYIESLLKSNAENDMAEPLEVIPCKISF